MKAVEEAGFRIVRIVTDNHQTNTAMFRQMSDDNTLQHVVPHPTMPFVRTEDDRLSWLEVDFISYLEDIKLESTKSWVKSLTKETYEATIMTIRSTVAVIEYLLTDLKFKYVLTRPLNSDPVESLFSCFRQFNAGNDRVDARTAVFTAEKLLKVRSCNLREMHHMTEHIKLRVMRSLKE
ncbi:hypothetical protein HPB47_017675 [Ixodes persulcatus]|uniref:Uncharacterized protein n=1 Tax=Ixodes persulcatus TaxID=34615 RepID=A0AC60QQ96_IXOPE|nr:hypothetical protein HPB47_017675 [Ixodes persulcatus]